MTPKHKRLTMTYMPEEGSAFVPDEQSEETDQVKVTPEGVVIGVPLIESYAIPPNWNNDEQENV